LTTPFEPIDVTVDGQAVRIFRGAEVRHALNFAGGYQLLARVKSGQAIVWDDTAGAPTDLSGALYSGQKLTIRPQS
jgi:hypothetical protein